jgi:hypothetical protein
MRMEKPSLLTVTFNRLIRAKMEGSRDQVKSLLLRRESQEQDLWFC